MLRRLSALAILAVAATTLVPATSAHAAAATSPSLKWERATSQGFQESSPLVTNLNGQNDVVVGNIDGKLYAANSSDGSDVGGWPRATGNGIDASPSSADIDGSGHQTVFVGSGTPAARAGDLNAFNYDGSTRWSFHPSDNDFPNLSMFSSPALGDVNGDGRPDVSAFSLGLLGWSFSADGAKNKNWPFYQDDTVFSSPALYDADGDGKLDYIVGGDSSPGGPVDHRGGFMRAIRGDGSLIWAFPVDEMVRSSPAIGDIDGDGKPEIVFGTGDYWKNNGGANDSSKIFALNMDGTLKWSRDLGAYTPASPVLADVNGDGVRDVVEGTWSGGNPGKVWVYDGSGNTVANWGGRDSGGGVVIGQISTADVNGDGKQDLFVPTGAGVFVYDGATATKLFAFNEGLVAYQNAPYIGDVDGNGKLDVVIAGTKPNGSGLLSRYEFPNATAQLGTLGWSQFRKDNRLTGSVYASTLYNNPCAAGPNEGYWMAAADGGVFGYCQSRFYGSMGGQKIAAPVVAIQSTPSKDGYWEVGADGGIYAFGSAQFHGSAGGIHLASPIVGMTRTPSGQGYWLVAADGGIFAYGDAAFYGSMGGSHLNKPIVGMTSTPTGHGYWLVASDGGVFAYGDAPFFGSMGGQSLNKPIVGMTTTADGAGYWFVAADGGIFAYGSAGFYGSAGSTKLNSPIVGMDRNAGGNGYRLVAQDGGIFAYNSTFLGSTGAIALNQPIVAMSTWR